MRVWLQLKFPEVEISNLFTPPLIGKYPEVVFKLLHLLKSSFLGDLICKIIQQSTGGNLPSGNPVSDFRNFGLKVSIKLKLFQSLPLFLSSSLPLFLSSSLPLFLSSSLPLSLFLS
jgi:hypothetical protein